MNQIQELASGKTATVVVPVTATADSWAAFITSSAATEATLIVVSIVVSVSIVAINIQSFVIRARAEKRRNSPD